MRNHKRKTSLLPLAMMASGLLLIMAVILWQAIVANQNSAASTPPVNPTQVNIPYPEVTRISLTDAKAAYDAGVAVFLDVRDSNSYTASHIPGSLHIELAALSSRLSELDPSRQIITYCT